MSQAATEARSSRVHTQIPGPKSAAILARKDGAVAAAMTVTAPVVIAKAEGALLTDVDGNSFIDFGGGVGVMNVGHGNPHVLAAIHRQVDAFTHTDFTVTPYENYVTLAERINATLPISGPVRGSFFNSGAEAVENAVKIAKIATGRAGVITFDRAFHGRTLMAMTLTSKTHPYKAGFGPFAPEVYRAPYPSPFHDGLDPDAAADTALAGLRSMFKTHVAAESVAAIILEPVQGEGGFIVPSKRWLEGIRSICDEYGIVMIDDEVQAGYGRTGKMWAIEHFGVEPDLVCMAKSIAAGLPLSGVFGKAKIMDAVHDSGIGGTYVGNPVAIEAGLAVLDVLENGLLERGAHIGAKLRSELDALAASESAIGDVRGLGAMLAVEFAHADRTPDTARAAAVAQYALEHGLLVLRAGVGSNCIRVLVPFAITDEQLDEAVGILRDAVAQTAS